MPASTPIDIDAAHDLQRLELSFDPACQGLYQRVIDAAIQAETRLAREWIAAGCILRLDTLPNAFFERYWRELADLRSLELVVMTSGSCAIRAIRRTSDGSKTVVAEVRAQGTQVASALPISLTDMPVDDAVIYVEVEALGETATLHEGAWRTRDQPRNEVRLVIATCSFGREPMLLANLDRLAETVARTAEISELVVVHQGKQALTQLPSYKTLLASGAFEGKLRIIHQDNFGGTGGFARGMIEALERDASHVLLLDDDIKIDPTSITRLVTLLGFLTAPVTIGGQMLDLDRPTIMHASHESVSLKALTLCNPCKGLDMTTPEAIDLFAARHPCDYNAWWFCCIPISTILRIGFPVPMFVRYDDIEFGVRAVAEGNAVVAFPGIFVWHEGYSRKRTCSFIYYDRRNAMIASALHGQFRPLRAAIEHWRHAWSALRKLRFEGCWALCRAADDFLAGPELVFSDLPGRHRTLLAEQARLTLLTMAAVQYYSRSGSTQNGRYRPSISRAVLTGRLSSSTVRSSPSEAKFSSAARSLAYDVARTSLALLLQGRRAGVACRAATPSFTSPASWRRLLKLPSKQDRAP